ncbi:MAG: YqgE/AlgH family protein [Sphingobacteriales bacterium]|nr:YqgE/AlgH family protein [Sphingobacteriales bacterium]
MIEPARGILLIADPFLKDPNFLRTVVLLCEHQPEGSFGFVINRPFESTLDELIPELEGHKLPVFDGGPVQRDSLHFLHQSPGLIPGGQELIKGVYWGGDFETLVSLLREGKISPDKIRFFIGYSGWGEGQLNTEMAEKTWLTVTANRKLIFHQDHQAIWKDSLRHLGGDYEMMINFPLDPQFN